MSVQIRTVTGADLSPLLPALAQLRITVFREWPYLYDGSEDYEQTYLRRYAESPQAAIIVALDNDRPIGASTCIPLAQAGEAISAPFVAQGHEIEQFCYFGESVLLAEWRGQGIGAAFFREREAHAVRLGGIDYTTFCAVRRPADHPLRPASYTPLDEFWRKRGYTSRPDIACKMAWREVGAHEESDKTLTFWLKSLSGRPLPEVSAA